MPVADILDVTQFVNAELTLLYEGATIEDNLIFTIGDNRVIKRSAYANGGTDEIVVNAGAGCLVKLNNFETGALSVPLETYKLYKKSANGYDTIASGSINVAAGVPPEGYIVTDQTFTNETRKRHINGDDFITKHDDIIIGEPGEGVAFAVGLPDPTTMDGKIYEIQNRSLGEINLAFEGDEFTVGANSGMKLIADLGFWFELL